MITVQLLYAATSLVSAACLNDDTATIWMERRSGSETASSWHTGLLHEDPLGLLQEDHGEADDASLLQLSLHSDSPQQAWSLAKRANLEGSSENLHHAKNRHAAEKELQGPRTVASGQEIGSKRLDAYIKSIKMEEARSRMESEMVLPVATVVLILVLFVCLGCWLDMGKRDAHGPDSSVSSAFPRMEPKKEIKPAGSSASSSEVPQGMAPAARQRQKLIENREELTRQMAPTPGMPLCLPLVIPEGARLQCVLQNDLRRQKQSMAFNVTSVASRGGTPLFKIRVEEFREHPMIFLETVDGTEQLASLSTEELWSSSGAASSAPALSIYRPKGALYGRVQKNAQGEYQVMRGQTILMTMSGDFGNHDTHITTANGQFVASTWQKSPEEYQVNVMPGMDAGLVVLALLAIDKCVQ